MIIIAVFLKCIQFTVALNSKTIEQINCHENQRFVFQTLRQQLGFYAKQVKIVNGPAGPVLIIKETAENRQVSYYRASRTIRPRRFISSHSNQAKSARGKPINRSS